MVWMATFQNPSAVKSCKLRSFSVSSATSARRSREPAVPSRDPCGVCGLPPHPLETN